MNFANCVLQKGGGRGAISCTDVHPIKQVYMQCNCRYQLPDNADWNAAMLEKAAPIIK